MAKLKVNNHHHFQDVAGIIALTGTYAVSERFVESKFDIRVQKIGGTYRTYVYVTKVYFYHVTAEIPGK